MPVARDFLCFSHDWTGDPLSKTHLMRLAAAAGHRVLWVNSIGYRTPSLASGRDLKRAVAKLLAAAKPVREVEPNLFVLSPLAVPAHGNPRVVALNRWLLKSQVRRATRALGIVCPVNWVFNPAAAVIAGELGESQLLYYCVDMYTAFAGIASEALADLERGLLEKADLVVVSAERLLQSKRLYNANTHLVRHGVDVDHFRTALDPRTVIPEDLNGLPRPLIGYFGLLAEDWVDVGLLAHVARSLPQASLVLVGKSTMNLAALEALPNVHLLGRKPYAQLPAYCRAFDVGLIPFPISEATLNSNPLKAREYLAAGLPVVSTAIPEVEALNACRIGRSPSEFVDQIKAALADPAERSSRSELMRGESWRARLDTVLELLSDAAAAKHSRPLMATA